MVPRVEPGLVRCWSSSAVMVLADATWLEEVDAVETLARPKSRILAWPRLVTKMLAGLMSRWTMPWECAASRPSAISMARERMVSLLKGWPAMRGFKVTPSRYSMAINDW